MDFNPNLIKVRKDACAKVGSDLLPPEPRSKMGIAIQTLGKNSALNGIRHLPVNGTNGWYIWAGDEPGSEVDFFKSFHIEHSPKYLGQAIKFLGLSPGWRFLIQNDYEDVWFDKTIVHE